MLLTISTTHTPATDLSFLLHKAPGHLQSFTLPFGTAQVFYPEANDERCTAALLLEVDPIGLVRQAKSPEGEGGLLRQYVNDRPYVASSFMSVAISKVFGSALGGRSRERAEVAAMAIPLEAQIAAVPCRGGEKFARAVLEPLGYDVAAETHPLDPVYPEWGDSVYLSLTLKATCRLADLLSHLYVLLPVFDTEKHYWVGSDEVEKLLRHGSGWLATHPMREVISARYLKRQRRLVRDALERLAESDEAIDDDAEAEAEEASEPARPRLNEERLNTVLAALRASGAKRVLDLGCGEGQLLKLLARDDRFEQILGMDVSHRSLESATADIERLPDRVKRRVEVIHGSLLYRDARLAGWDAAAVVEVIEHFEPSRIASFQRNVFEFAQPGTVVLTTPNAEYNSRYEGLGEGGLRHRDHRFEWTRAEFRAWAGAAAEKHGYAVRYLPVGPEDPHLGSPTQMAVFERWS